MKGKTFTGRDPLRLIGRNRVHGNHGAPRAILLHESDTAGP